MTNQNRMNELVHEKFASVRKAFARDYDRVIFVSDLHGSKYFKPFIEKFENNRSFFICTGDIFDRGQNSYEIYETIRKLHSEGKFEMCLGNHDLFFIFAFGLHPEADNVVSRLAKRVLTEEQRFSLWEIFYDQLYINGGNRSVESFLRGVGEEKLKEKINEVVNFLFHNFSLQYSDPIGNVGIHGGIATLGDGSIVGETIRGKFISGLDYVNELDNGLQNLDYNTLLRLAAREKQLGCQIWDDMKANGAIVDPNVSANYRGDYTRYFLPTWYDNSVYEKTFGKNTITPLQSLRQELDKNGLERLITGHWGVDHPDWSNRCSSHATTHYGTILRLDRSHVRKEGQYGNFGYAIIDAETNEIEEIGDAIDLFIEKDEEL